jgi:hypothetical protein
VKADPSNADNTTATSVVRVKNEPISTNSVVSIDENLYRFFETI